MSNKINSEGIFEMVGEGQIFARRLRNELALHYVELELTLEVKDEQAIQELQVVDRVLGLLYRGVAAAQADDPSDLLDFGLIG